MELGISVLESGFILSYSHMDGYNYSVKREALEKESDLMSRVKELIKEHKEGKHSKASDD